MIRCRVVYKHRVEETLSAPRECPSSLDVLLCNQRRIQRHLIQP